MLSTSHNQQKLQEETNTNSKQGTKANVASELAPAVDLTGVNNIPDTQSFIQLFKKNNIAYKPDCKYESFSFEVEQYAPALNFYKIHVKIAHFSLTVSAAKQILQNVTTADICGNYGEISFIDLGGQSLCLKSFSFKTTVDFQILFPQVVKEWIILRICSALGCAPYAAHLLGFDLLIFEDCIQFATEKGEGIKKFSLEDVNALRQELALIHSLKIIHFDIKPENIVFSNHFGKPVFIDFGLSQIIKEKIGFKTFVTFKGTPNFCSPQMLAIMLENTGYVDLYYNDNYGLDMTLNIEQEHNLLTSFEEINKRNSDFNINEYVSQAITVYAISIFQFYYIENNQFKARQALRLLLNHNNENVKKVLQFIKSTIRFVFIRQIFEKDLSKYSPLMNYKEIQQLIRKSAGVFYYKASLNKSASLPLQQSMQNCKINIMSSSTDPQKSQPFLHYFCILLNLNQLEDKNVTNFIAITFQCVRFDKKNLEVSQKKQIADRMNSLLFKYLQMNTLPLTGGDQDQTKLDEKKELKQIKLLFSLIFEFCIVVKDQKSDWTKRHIFDVCQQMILTDVSFLQYMDKLQNYVEDNFTTPKEEVLAMFQYTRLFDTMNIIDTSHTTKFDTLQNILSESSLKYLRKYLQQPSLIQDIQMTQIRYMLRILQEKTDNSRKHSFQRQDQQIAKIQDMQIRKYMHLYLTKKKLDYLFILIAPEQVFKISEFAKRSNDIQSLDFLSLSILVLKIMKGVNNNGGINTYYKYMSSVINCATISSSLMIRQQQSLTNSDFDSNYVEGRITQIIKRHKHSFRQQTFANQIFDILFLIYQTKIAFTKNFKKQFCLLYNLYKKWQTRRFHNKLQILQLHIRQFAHTFFYIKIQYFFYYLSSDTQQVFLINLCLAQDQYQRITADQKEGFDVNKALNLYFWTFNMYFYQLYYHIHIKEYEICFVCISKIRQLLKGLQLDQIMLEIIRLQIDLAIRWNKKDMVEKSVLHLYNYCRQIDYTSFYLLPYNKKELLLTFRCFQESDSALLYKFIDKLVQIIMLHPVQQYFENFASVVNEFLVFNGSKGNVLHYSRFIDSQGRSKAQSNPYFLIFHACSLLNEDKEAQLKLFKVIAMHCDRLSEFARKKILQKCFGAYFLNLQDKEKNIRKMLFVFRKVKEFISWRDARKILKDMVVIQVRGIYQRVKLKQKLKKYRNCFL